MLWMLCKIVLARPDGQEICPYHFSVLFTMVRRSLCDPIACWILEQTSSLATLSLYEVHSIVQYHLISMAHILLCSCAVRVHDSQTYKKMGVTRERSNHILEMREMLLLFQTGFNFFNAAVVCAILESVSGLKPSSYTTERRYFKFVTLYLL